MQAQNNQVKLRKISEKMQILSFVLPVKPGGERNVVPPSPPPPPVPAACVWAAI